jgi:hypothetical protein
MDKVPKNMRIDPRFYQIFLEFKMREEVKSMTEFQRMLMEKLQKQDKRLRFFK